MRRLTLDIDGPVNVADFGGSGPAVVLLHGLGGSHVNWTRLGPLLAEHARVIAPDFPGFGYSPPAGRSTTLEANAAWLDRFLDQVVGGPAILVGNSMGGLISLLTVARSDERVAGLALISPALPLAPREPRDMQVTLAFGAYFTPGLGELFLRRRARLLGPEGLVRETFRLCCVDPARVPDEVIQAHVAVSRDRARMSWADASVLRAARSLVRLVLRRPGFRAMLRRVRPPVLLLNGEGDRLVKVAAARVAHEVRRDWTFVPLPDVGHVPQLEAPERTAEAILEWLEDAGRQARETAAGSPLPMDRVPSVAAER
ncbi:MAG: alpha/beta hydrolase [Actinomycetota bacterium]|nr:alpha/beta hydrolase [Actinomycetota bacterium]